MRLETVRKFSELKARETWVVYEGDLGLYLGFNKQHNKIAIQYQIGFLYENADDTKAKIKQGLMQKVVGVKKDLRL